VSNCPGKGKTPILRAGNIADKLDTQNDLVWVPGETVDDDQLLRRNDIAICMSSGSPEVVGKTARVSTNIHASVGSFCGIIRPKNSDEASFLSFYFRSSAFARHRDIIARGANIQNLRFSSFEVIELEFPSAYREIARQLEQADRLRRLCRYTLEMSDSFLPAIFIEMFGDPGRNIKEWPTESLGSLGDVRTGGTPSSQKTGMFGGKTPFITPGDLEVDTVHSQRFLTDAGVKENVTVRAGSTLVCCIGATIGKTDKARVRCSFNQQINAIEWGKNINDDFGFYLMRFFSLVVADRGRSTTLPILKKSAFEELILPVPPEPLQQRFSQIVRRHERLHSTQAESLRQSEHLFQSLLHQAFSEN